MPLYEKCECVKVPHNGVPCPRKPRPYRRFCSLCIDFHNKEPNNLKIAYSVWDEDGLSIIEFPLPDKAFGVSIIDGKLELSYDSDIHAVEFMEDGKRVDSFEHVEIRDNY
jgi:hypothetical protein